MQDIPEDPDTPKTPPDADDDPDHLDELINTVPEPDPSGSIAGTPIDSTIVSRSNTLLEKQKTMKTDSVPSSPAPEKKDKDKKKLVLPKKKITIIKKRDKDSEGSPPVSKRDKRKGSEMSPKLRDQIKTELSDILKKLEKMDELF